MNTRAKIVLIALLGVMQLSGCQAMMYGKADKLNRISVGMPKQQVLQELGAPATTSASGNEEILKYKWMKTTVSWAPKYFFVRLVDGKVQAYGEEDEQNGTRQPEP